MALTLDEVKAMLEPEEPNYAAAEGVGSEALPHLEEIASGPDEWLAARAVSFASRMSDPRAVEVVRRAATSASPRIRGQAAHGARHLRADEAVAILAGLLDDPDTLVRSVSIKSAAAAFDGETLPQDLVDGLARLAQDDPEPFIRDLSRATLG